ncbi:hypothetical protein [Campylobacter helveticus]|uniref:hypothetical protein n=1 Tax=Campylobacter helveticus TaxID=28898 RepID=UPI00111231FE|nr:hypothetical protein [Campylobacter helveticus]TNB61108.1 hypothetical protein FDW43_09240 [Campylobacter helveticus]
MSEYGRYILEEVTSIREKNDLIKNAKLDYKSFNEYRIMLSQIENFDINKNYSDSELLKKLNAFIHKVDSLFEEIIVRNHLLEQNNESKKLFDYSEESDICFYEALKQIKLFTHKKDFSKEELGFFLEELDELLLNKEFSENQTALLEQSLELFKEEYLAIGQEDNESLDESKEQKNSVKANKR